MVGERFTVTPVPSIPGNFPEHWTPGELGLPRLVMKLYRLDKIVLRVRNNVEKFLNGLASNTLDTPRNAFLTLHGRIIATFDQVKIGDDEFLIVVERFALEALMQHVKKYLMLNRTIAEQTSLNVYFDLDGAYAAGPDEYKIAQKTGQMIITPKELAVNVSDDEFTFFRLKNNIAAHGVDYTDELLLNIDEYEHVSYTKGCFLGQEPIAKVHNRSKPTWKLVVRYEDELTEDEKIKMTSKTLDPQSGKTMGFVFIKNKAVG
jgi:folate-binding protein YgfZ